MSTNSKSTGRMATREGGRDKIARVMERLRSGGIVEDGSNSNGPSKGDTPVVLGGESTQSSTQKKANNTRAAKTKPKKKKMSLKETGKSSTSTGVNAAAQSEVAARLAEIEDKYQKQHKAAASSHPRHLEGNGPEQRTAVEETSANDGLPTRSLGQPVINPNIDDCGILNMSSGDSEFDDESPYPANKTIEANDLDNAGGECLTVKPTPTIASHQRNIAEKIKLNSVNAELCSTQQYVKASRPKPRRVRPQPKDLSIPPQAGGNATALKAITQCGAKTTAPDEALACVYDDAEDLDIDLLTEPSEQHKSDDEDLDSIMSDGEPDIDIEVMPEAALAPATKTKTKTKTKTTGRTKGKKTTKTMSQLRDQIRANRKEVPNAEIGHRGNVRHQTFETPSTKKNVMNQIEQWAQGLPPPPFKKQRTSVTGTSRSTSSGINPNLRKIAAPRSTTTTKSSSNSCAIIVDSTTEVLRKKPAPGSKRSAKDLESDSDTNDEDAVRSLYEGLGEDEDDTLEQADAASSPVKACVAAQASKKSLNIRCGIVAPVQVKKASKRQGNQQLPDGALDGGKWASVFIPTFLRYVGCTQHDVWALKSRETITALQGIWNEVYKGDTQHSRKKFKHLVESGGAVHRVSTQRLIEWRSAIGSNGLTVVGDFMTSSHLETGEEQQDAAEYLLDHHRYMYLKTRDPTENGGLVKRSGRYRGPLVVQTMAQCLIDFEGAVEVPGFAEWDQFPYAALVLSATSVHRALWLWAKGYITKESHDNAKSTKSSGIIKMKGRDGKFTKETNFSKDRWDIISDVHMRDVLAIEAEKLRVLEGDIQNSIDILRRRKVVTTKRGGERDRLDSVAQGSGYQHRAAFSDSDV